MGLIARHAHRRRGSALAFARALGVALVLLFGAAGPGGPAAAVQPAADEARFRSIEQTSAEAKRVIVGIVLRMRGQAVGETDPDLMIPQDVDKRLVESFRYQGFQLINVAVELDREHASFPGARTVAGLLVFLDGASRGTAVSFYADYIVIKEKIKLLDASVRDIVPRRPPVTLSFVPAATIDLARLAAIDDYQTFFEAVTAKAVRLAEPGNPPLGIDDYYVFAFVRARLAPDAVFAFRVSDSSAGLTGTPVSTARRSFNGWQVLRMSGRFALGAEPGFFLKLLYRPGSDTPEKERTLSLVGLYSSKAFQGAPRAQDLSGRR
jgi:hypothetical protein